MPGYLLATLRIQLSNRSSISWSVSLKSSLSASGLAWSFLRKRGLGLVKGYDRRYGARPMNRLIDRELRKRLANELLFGALRDGGTVKVLIVDEKIELVLHAPPQRHRQEQTERKRTSPVEVN